ncbi:MAG: basic secretory protein-like protein [Salinibacter sp.]
MRYRLPAVSTAVLLLVGVVLAPTADAQYFGKNRVQYETFDFKTLETEHFVFHFYPAEKAAVKDAARMAERWYDRHTEVFLHRFDEKKPIIFYANAADFQQTNVARQPIGPGTGGFTESLRERVVMPFTASYAETNHVLGHELVHSFQYDLGLNADSLNIQLNNLPTWLIEGMAEYLSVGRRSSHTAMWMRDAVRRDTMPTFEQLNNPQAYFPYRYGQAYLAYIGGKYGDQAVTDLFKRGGQVGLDSAYVELFGVTTDSLTKEWAQATRDTYKPLMKGRTPPDSIGKTVLSEETTGGNTNVGPVLSPDGRYVAYISAEQLVGFNLYVADAETGEVVAELERAGTTGHFNALRFISSAGTWSPDGRRLAFVSSAQGDNQITVWNVETEEIERSIQVKGVTSMKNPAWSPDGTRLAFSGTDGGVSDLFVLDLETDAVRQLTNDRYADLQPTWAPSGETIAFATDRAETNLDRLAPSSNMDLGLIDVESREITVREPFGDALHHNPQFSPDGESLYFISDQDGFKDVYRLDRSTDRLHRVTHLKTGVSGITALSPAMSVASQSGEMMLSVYGGGGYTGVRIGRDETTGTPLRQTTDARGPAPADTDTTLAADTPIATDTTGLPAATRAGVLPPTSALGEGLIATNLSDYQSGLPPASTDYEVEDLDPSLSLEAISPPRVGASVGGPLGGGAQGGVAFRFGDMLGHQTLTVSVQARGTFRDIGGGVSYLNQRGQLNWGGSIGHRPIVFGANTVPIPNKNGQIVGAASVVQRAFLTSANGRVSYPLDPTRRFELSAGATRYGFGTSVREVGVGVDLTTEDINQLLGRRVFREPDPEYFATSSLAYVRDFSISALTGPIRGGRWRLEVAPSVGSQDFVTARVDARRYLYAEPFTLALQGLHVGNYGAEFGEGLGIGNEYIGYPYGQGFIRGYSVQDIAASIRENGEGCIQAQGVPIRSQCAKIDRLFGTRSLVGRAELRVPLLGPESISLIPFRYLPTTLGVFADAGVTWTGQQGPDFTFETNSGATNIPVVSSGVTARFNVLGRLLIETYLAHPFQRGDTNWTWGVRLSPGF